MKWLLQVLSRIVQTKTSSDDGGEQCCQVGSDPQNAANFFILSYKTEAEQQALDAYTRAAESGQFEKAEYYREVLSEIYKNGSHRG